MESQGQERFEITEDDINEVMTAEDPNGLNETIPTIPVEKKPTVVITIGMAGSGKSTFSQRMQKYTFDNQINSYYINLDPAVVDLGFEPNLDIRDTLDYKKIMTEYKLGPNGAIMTCLNLFATQLEEVLTFIDKRAEELEYVFIDTPGQIEMFTWSASGQIIAELFSGSYPTVAAFIVDSVRCRSPITFSSCLFYASSILYRMNLPLLLAFNKSDLQDSKMLLEWMQNPFAFWEALDKTDSYMGVFARSQSLLLEAFYENIPTATMSSITGAGVDSVFQAFDAQREVFIKDYLPAIQEKQDKIKQARDRKEKTRIQLEIEKISKDMSTMGIKVEGTLEDID
ncbi:hypothetical protein PCE1_002641 [Barthelona sp. PCE]